jgi:hypothetical protein
MISLIGFTIGLFTCSTASAYQEIDSTEEVTFDESIQWLEKHLSYSYLNKSSKKWWNNSLSFEKNTGTVVIRNSSSDVPNGVDKNVYYGRSVKLTDLDFRAVKIIENKQDKGRISKGKMIQIDVIGRNKKIQKTYNGRASIKESFIRFPITEENDSLYTNIELCKSYFEQAIALKSKVTNSGDSLENTSRFFKTITGSFDTEEGSACLIDELFSNTLEFQFRREGTLYKKSVVSYDEPNHHFIYWMVNAAGSSHHFLDLIQSETLELVSLSGDFKIQLHGMNHFTIYDEGEELEYYRSDF